MIVREASAADLDGITHVRTSVRQNHLSREQLDARGITNASIAASFETTSKGWVAVEPQGRIAAFSIADRATRSIFALFVLPEYERQGLGTKLLDHATGWLFEAASDPIWLTTGADTDAAGFYALRGWRTARVEPDGQLRFELSPTPSSTIR